MMPGRLRIINGESTKSYDDCAFIIAIDGSTGFQGVRRRAGYESAVRAFRFQSDSQSCVPYKGKTH